MNRAHWAALALSTGAVAACADDPKPAPPTARPPAAPVTFDQLPGPVRLGVRVLDQARRTAVIDTVVIVKDARSYAAAVGLWKADALFPVLIDDGSHAARENIGRFVRAMQPAAVVAWDAPKEFAWPASAREQGDLLSGMVSRARMRTDESLKESPRWDAAATFGVVVTRMDDTAWPAALALGAARRQPLVIVESKAPADTGATISVAEVRAISDRVTADLTAMGLKWESIGDVDAVTLCMNTPVKTKVTAAESASLCLGNPPVMTPKEGESLATTDVLGRMITGASPSKRWAWAGQVTGNHASSAYRAMCSIFLRPENAWVFDAYPDEEPFSLFSGAKAAQTLTLNGIKAAVNSARQRNLDGWRTVAGAPLNAGLVLMNSSGLPYHFEVELKRQDRALAMDVPLLSLPAAAHVVHSWSATNPENRWTIAGRWLDHGCYAYVGSVEEPRLGAFVPTPMLVEKLFLACPLGAAARHENMGAWRVTVLGDPLVMVMPKAGDAAAMAVTRARSRQPLPMKADDLTDRMKVAARERKMDEAIRLLVLLGRDADACKLAGALLDEGKFEEMSPAWAGYTVGAAARRGDHALLARAYRLAIGRITAERNEEWQDALWQTLWARRDMLAPSEIDLLKQTLRRDSFLRDALDVAEIIERQSGKPAAVEFVRTAAERATTGATDSTTKDKLLEWTRRR